MMATRKKPQQQLASYFDELLTELSDDQLEETEPSVAKNTAVVSSTPHSQTFHHSPDQNADITETLTTNREATAIVAKPVMQPEAFSQGQTSQPLKERNEALAKIQQAKLQRLLHSLAPDIETVKPEDQAALAKNFVTPLPDSVAEPAVDVEEKVGLTDTAVAESEASEEVAAWQPLEHRWLDNGRPVWAQERFDVLLFTVQGIDLAVPLAALDSIYPMNVADDLTPLFGQAEWFLGLQTTLTGRTKVIDTARFLMPERYQNDQQQQLQYSVALNGSGWSLAVEAVNQPKIVSPEAIRWRVNRHKRPWVAGTLKDEMCILLDIPCLVEHLQS